MTHGNFEQNVEMILKQNFGRICEVLRFGETFICNTKFKGTEYTVKHTPRGLNSTIMASEFIELFSEDIPHFRYYLQHSFKYTKQFQKDRMFLQKVLKEIGNQKLIGVFKIYESQGGGSFEYSFDRNTETLREDAHSYLREELPHLML